ncbi:GL17215 [Drosophila persimilis]|uniref:GL17215 n=1 Tax=Drosophila persimilis TaxID=7234 RepID=B4GG38_DROPE|nr:uncharacterized protein LOC6593120 [Drosophila persimilis]EDW35458.1 GL17215 [Drosophila persimilis]
MFAYIWQTSAVILLLAMDLSLTAARPQLQEVPHALLDIETPNQFSYSPSPLQQPDSLRSKPYFDFLSTLYAHDTAKSNLFRPYSGRPRRDALSPIASKSQSHRQERKRRAIVFRPLFVYKQQEIRKQEIKDRQAERRIDQQANFRL